MLNKPWIAIAMKRRLERKETAILKKREKEAKTKAELKRLRPLLVAMTEAGILLDCDKLFRSQWLINSLHRHRSN